MIRLEDLLPVLVRVRDSPLSRRRHSNETMIIHRVYSEAPSWRHVAVCGAWGQRSGLVEANLYCSFVGLYTPGTASPAYFNLKRLSAMGAWTLPFPPPHRSFCAQTATQFPRNCGTLRASSLGTFCTYSHSICLIGTASWRLLSLCG